ncbi:MAG: tellurite resistance/C4-dicarboxylate transporter family protein [Bryobacterales bacterium]|nr:tellurite resistance/C4-dicarboxylate transporter family protein [Bryobacterales bacterium]
MLREAIRSFFPGYFAMVMATGIVSIAAHWLEMPLAARALFGFNVGLYCFLWLLTVLRLAWFPRLFLDDLCDHRRGPPLFTLVAASSVLGSQFVLLAGRYTAAFGLWAASVVLWFGLTYAIFPALTVKSGKPPLQEGITGVSLLAVVATQSIAVLGALLAAHWRQPYRLEANFFSLCMWLCGGMLYIWIISLIFYRYTFLRFSPADLAPSYWINMGAMAISALAGARLIENAPDAPFLNSLLPFLKGFTLFYWATGTWWIPMLGVLAVWRYVYRRSPLRYDASYWAAVFPLGMYTVCTWEMARALEMAFLYAIPRFFVYVALAAWAAALAGLSWRLLRRPGKTIPAPQTG